MTTQEGLSHILESVTHEKDLGVNKNNNLRFSKHIQNQKNKAKQVL
jgi:hypothetical protein